MRTIGAVKKGAKYVTVDSQPSKAEKAAKAGYTSRAGKAKKSKPTDDEPITGDE